MNKFSLLLAASLVITSTADADNRDLGQKSLAVGIGDVDWTIDPKFYGTKLLLGGRYIFKREAATAYEEPDAEILKYRIDLQDFQVGDSETDMEYGVAGFTYWTYQNKKEFTSAKKI